jgi:hypothetical protein
MHAILAFLVTALYTISWVGYSKYQFLERDSQDPQVKTDANKKWHRWEFVNHVAFLLMIALYAGIGAAIVLTFGYQIGFNTLLNVYVLKQPYYHLGDNDIDGWMKKTFGEKKAYFVLLGIFAISLVLAIAF